MQYSSGDKLTQETLRRLGAASVPMYTLFVDSGTYYAEANYPGNSDDNDTDADALLTRVIGYLTGSRANKESIALKGAFTFNNSVTIPAYTVLDLRQAKITAASGFPDTTMFITSGADVEILGGILDGNSQTTLHGIYIRYGDTLVDGTEVLNFGYNGIGVWADTANIENVVLRDVKGSSTVGTGWPVFAVTSNATYYARDVAMINPTVTGTSNDVGIVVEVDSRNVTLFHPYVRDTASDGVFIDKTTDGQPIDTKIIGGTAYSCGGSGFGTEGLNTVFAECTAEENDYDGFFIKADCTGARVIGCAAKNNGKGTNAGRENGVYLEGGADNVYIGGNRCYDDQGTKTQEYGISMGNGCTYVTVQAGNLLAGNNAGCINYGTLPVPFYTPRLVVPFSDVSGGALTSTGWDVDANTEYAIAFFTLPHDFQELIYLRIWAQSVVTEADAMRLEIVAYGGTDNEAYNTEAVNIADKASASTNFAANDIIYWEIDSSDDADLGHLATGDSVVLQALHEAAGGADCATDAHLRSIELRYV